MAQSDRDVPVILQAEFRARHRRGHPDDTTWQAITFGRMTHAGSQSYLAATNTAGQRLRTAAKVNEENLLYRPYYYDIRIAVQVPQDAVCKFLCKEADSYFWGIHCIPQSKTLGVETLTLELQLHTLEPISPRLVLTTTGPLAHTIDVMNLKHRDVFDLVGLPRELQRKVLHAALVRSDTSIELIDGGVGKDGERVRKKTKNQRYPVREAERVAMILGTMEKTMPGETEDYFGKNRLFKFSHTRDAFNFLQGIGRLGLEHLRAVKICSWSRGTGVALFQDLMEAKNLELLHITAMCVGETGCRLYNSRQAAPRYAWINPRDGSLFLDDFTCAISQRFTDNSPRMLDILAKKPILCFDRVVIAYGANFGSYLEEGSPEDDGRSQWIATPADAQAFLQRVADLSVLYKLV